MYHDFGSEWGESHWWFQGRIKIVDFIFRELSLHDRNMKILDIGCGTGVMLPLLSRYGMVDGLDSSEIAIDYCRKKNIGGVNLIAGSFPDALPAGAQYDLVTIFDVIEHIEDDIGMFKDIHCLLKPGGLLVCTVPAYKFLWGPHDMLNQHKRRYTKKSIVKKAQEAGFEIKRASYFNTFLFTPIVCVKLWRKIRTGSPEKLSDLRLLRNKTLNNLFEAIFSSEKFVLKYINMPFGLSLFIAGIKRK